jgi:hypothetical protein
LLALVAAVVQGCAFTYVDAHGDRHAIGLLDITIHSPASIATVAGDVVEVTTFGLSVGSTAQGGYVTAGYNHEVTAALRDDALVIGNPVNLLAQTGKGQQGGQQ